ncbi:hypothetical protein H2203_008273 [Taxawa tesnikishii (nom. ined.)]|nr:hypothetical protein H2203_008273 [Dothideales sp. JES 119]
MKHTGRSPTAPCEQQVDDLEMDHIRDDDPRDDANEPLIENERDGVAGRTPERHASSGATSSPPFTATAATAGTRMLWLLTMSAGLSGLLFGYDTGIISSTLLHLPTTFPVVGAAVGAASGIVPLYIAEIAPDKMRGRLVTVQSLFITGGQVVAYLIGWAVGERWRWGVGLGAAPAIVQSFLLLGMVESPRWLVRSEREEQAKRVLRKLGGGEEGVELLMRRMRREVDMESTGKAGSALKELWVNRGNRRALGIACGLQGLQQLCGFNSLMYFSATIFALVGFTNPIATSLSVASTNFLFTLLAFGLIDSIGRRRILLLSIPFMVLGLFCCAVAFNHISFGDGSSHVSSTTTVSSAFTAVKNVMRGRDGGTSDSAGGSGLPAQPS